MIWEEGREVPVVEAVSRVLGLLPRSGGGDAYPAVGLGGGGNRVSPPYVKAR